MPFDFASLILIFEMTSLTSLNKKGEKVTYRFNFHIHPDLGINISKKNLVLENFDTFELNNKMSVDIISE